MSYFWIVLALFLTIKTEAHEQQVAEKSLELLCQNKSIELTRISQIEEIVKLLESNTFNFDCSQEVRDSILNLYAVIENKHHHEDVCSQEKVNQIREFHSRYISTNNKQTSGSAYLPKALRNFFLGFGLKVSLVCKKNMINSLILDTTEKLNPDDFSTMKSWTDSENGLISKISNSPTDYDDLLTMRDLISFSNPTANDKIFIQTASSKLLKKIQKTCISRFKPFYEKLILPLVELSNVGFNYQGEELQRELNELSTNSQVQQWYKITYLCQSLEDIEIIEEQEDKSKTEGIERNLVKILSKEEAAELKTKGGESLTGFKVDDFEKLVYEPEAGNTVEDVIIDGSDKNLDNLINTFDSRKSESDRIRLKVFRKIGSFLKETMKKGQLKIVSSLFGEQKGPKSKTDMIKALDDYIEQTTDLSSVDSPVSGVKDFGKRMYHEAAYMSTHGIGRKVYEKEGVTIFNLGFVLKRVLAIGMFIAGIAMLASLG